MLILKGIVEDDNNAMRTFRGLGIHSRITFLGPVTMTKQVQ